MSLLIRKERNVYEVGLLSEKTKKYILRKDHAHEAWNQGPHVAVQLLTQIQQVLHVYVWTEGLCVRVYIRVSIL